MTTPFRVCKRSDHRLFDNSFCGSLAEVLRGDDDLKVDIALLENITTTVGHYHRTFDEIYIVLAGKLTVAFFDPSTAMKWQEELLADELCVIPKGVHHKIVVASPHNKMMAICVPKFDHADETNSAELAI